MYAFAGILAALLERGRTGRGQVVEVSLLDSLAEWMGYPLKFAADGGAPPARAGAAHATIAPYGPFAVADGQVVLAVQNEREWRAFCAGVLCRPELADDPRFASNSLRAANSGALHAAVDAALGAESVAAVEARLAEARIAHGRVNDVGGLAAHPQLAARDRWREAGTPSARSGPCCRRSRCRDGSRAWARCRTSASTPTPCSPRSATPAARSPRCARPAPSEGTGVGTLQGPANSPESGAAQGEGPYRRKPMTAGPRPAVVE